MPGFGRRVQWAGFCVCAKIYGAWWCMHIDANRPSIACNVGTGLITDQKVQKAFNRSEVIPTSSKKRHLGRRISMIDLY